jgi:hypothetical protein
MKDTGAFEVMPRMNATQFAEMLASNDGASVGSRGDRLDMGQIPAWIDAVRNASRPSAAKRRKPRETSWKAATVLRGLLLSSHNATQSPARFSTSTAAAATDLPTSRATTPFFQTPFERPVSLFTHANDTSSNALLKRTLPKNYIVSTPPYITRNKYRATETHHGLVDQQIASVKSLLRKHGFNASAHAAADRVTLVNEVVTYLDRHPTNLSLVAQRLCKEADEYGGNRNETLTEGRQHAIVDNWLAERYLGDSLYAVVADMLTPSATAPVASPRLPYVENIRHRLLDKLDAQSPSPSQLTDCAKTYLRQRVIDKIFPALTWQPIDAEAFSHVEVGTLEWGFIQAGLRVAADLELDVSGWRTHQAREMGELLGLLVREGAAPEEWSGYFAIPAELYALTPDATNNTSAAHPRKDAALFNAITHFHEDALTEYHRNDPVQKFVTALESYQTRPKLAESTLAERCPGLRDPASRVTSYLDANEAYCVEGPEPSRFRERNQQRTILPKINTLFKEQNKHIAALSADLDRMLLPLTFEAMDEGEKHFLTQATVRRAQAKFDSRRAKMHTLTGVNLLALNTLTKHLPENIELFSARVGGEERIYALYGNSMSQTKSVDGLAAAGSLGYNIERVDRNDTRYREMLDAETRQYIAHVGDYTLTVAAKGIPLKHGADRLDVLCKRICEHHRIQMEVALHEKGYEKTTKEKVSAFLWDLVPFYSCTTGIARGDANAVVPCVIDVVSLIPLLGQAVSMTSRFGVAASRAGLTALRQAAAKAGLRGVIAQSGSILQRSSAAGIETLSAKAFKRLSSQTLRMLDPGIELIALTSRAALRRTSKLLNHLRSIYPSAGVLSKALASRADRARSIPAVITRKATFPGVSQPIDVVSIGARQGREVFVRIDPITGDRFGKKYHLDDDGKLALVPLPVRQRLKIILDQGLSGRGAMKAGVDLAAVHRRRIGPARNAPAQDVGHRPSRGGQEAPDAIIAAHDGAAAQPPASVRDRVSKAAVPRDQFYAARVMALPGKPPLTLFDLPKYELEEVVTRCDLNTLANLYQTSRVARKTVHDVINYKWSKKRLMDELMAAMRADQSRALNLLATEGLRIEKRRNRRSVLSESLPLRLSRDTYSALLAMIDGINGNIVRLPPSNERVDFLHAAIFLNNPNAINAILNCPRYTIRPEDWQVALAIHYRCYDAMEALIASGRFDTNMRVIGLSPLMLELRAFDNDMRYTELLLSRGHVDLRSGYVLDASMPLDPEKYRAVLRHTGTDVNAIYQHPQAQGNYITPLFSAVDRALRIPFDTSNFDVLVTIASLDVNKHVSIGGGRSISLIKYIKNYDSTALGTLAVPLKSYLVNALKAHPSYCPRRSCSIS